MLINFKVSNYLSFQEEQELSMIAGSTKKKENHIIKKNNDLKLLKFSAIYGANSSGKSNLIKAVSFAKNIILSGIRGNCSNLYCRINTENKDKMSSFDFEIEINNNLYAYGFDILLSKNSIKAEWLYKLNKKSNKEELIFNRKLHENINLDNNYFNNNKEILKRLDVYYSDMKDQDTILFLTIMNKNKDTLYREYNDNNVTIFKDIYNWFLNSLVIIFPQLSLDSSPLFLSEESLNKINELISKFGTGISQCNLVDSSLDELLSLNLPPEFLKNMLNNLDTAYINRVKNNITEKPLVSLRINREMFFINRDNNQYNVKKVVLNHKNNDGDYLFIEESDGTQRLFDLIGVLLNTKGEKVYFIDELDRCFHPELTYEFVKYFLEATENSQLVVTTHESRLLDFNLLRRDEIWFTDRDKNGPTTLYSLEKYNERFDKKIDKAYLEGRYGGIPTFEVTSSIGDNY